MQALYHLLNDNFFIQQPDGKYVSWMWLDKVVVDPHHGGDFYVRFKPNLRKFLLSASAKYHTIYKYSDIMLMKCKYSPRLYEIFRSNQSRQKVPSRGLDYSIKELHVSLGLMQRRPNGKVKRDKFGKIKFQYPRFSNFNKKVIKPAVHEINYLTEYSASVRYLYQGRKVIGINVVMRRKDKNQLVQQKDRIYRLTHHMSKKQFREHRIATRKGRAMTEKEKHDYEVKQFLQESKRHPRKFAVINIKGNEVYYYSPFAKKFIWTSRADREKQAKVYHAQKKIIDDLKNK